ncbi:MAG: hypothetical protein IPF54_24870 [Draconibacterium sp.]|nr:hypothetical protein [Draconibacterium sp.]
MTLNNLHFFITLILTSIFSNYSETGKSDIISEFNRIETTPEILNFSNKFEINNTDGHLQGIQEFENEHGKYVFMTGSSDLYSYCSVVKLGNENKVVSINKLMEKPFKHAGGFQIFQNYLAVGIEDNSAKNKSKVCIYDISEPENPLAKPIAISERNGEPLRSTAGCVGITKYKNKALIVVGDWDSKNLDFYSVDFDEINNSAFKKISSIDTESISKKDWINIEWHSYQNINLFNIDEKLYLIGLGQTKNQIILLIYTQLQRYQMIFFCKKIATKTFNCTNDCSFKAGAGIEYANEKFKVFACAYNIKSISYLNVFQSK